MTVRPWTAVVLAVRFFVEIGALVALAVGGAHLGGNALAKVGLALLFPAIAGTVWARFAAPKSAHRLPPDRRLVVEVLVFGSAVLALVSAGHPAVAGLFAAVAVIDTALVHVLQV